MLKQRRPLFTRGFTLMEIAIVLGLIGVLSGAIWVGALTVMENSAINHAIQQVTLVGQNIRDQFSNTQTPPGWTAGNDVTAGSASSMDGLQLFPSEMRQNPSLGYGVNGETITHAMNGAFQVLITSSGTGATPNGIKTPACTAGIPCFRFALSGLTQSYCMKILQTLPIADPAMGIVQAGVGNGNACTGTACVKACTGAPCFITAPLTPTTVLGWCNGAANDNIVFIDFKLHN